MSKKLDFQTCFFRSRIQSYFLSLHEHQSRYEHQHQLRHLAQVVAILRAICVDWEADSLLEISPFQSGVIIRLNTMLDKTLLKHNLNQFPCLKLSFQESMVGPFTTSGLKRNNLKMFADVFTGNPKKYW